MFNISIIGQRLTDGVPFCAIIHEALSALLQRNFPIHKSFPCTPVTFRAVNMKPVNTLSTVIPSKYPPAIPSDSPVSAYVQRWFLVHDSIADPFAERIVGHFRRSRKYDLGGQIALWEQESKKTV